MRLGGRFRKAGQITLVTIKSIALALLCGSFMFAATAAAERYSVAGDHANIRSGPGTAYEIAWQVRRNYPLFVIEKTGSWCYFRDFEGDKGWIHKSLLHRVPTIISSKSECNIRSGPGTGHRVLFTVDSGISFEVVQHQGNWIQIRHADGDEGWIHRSLIW
jgi:SH3-like domain-containing protein